MTRTRTPRPRPLTSALASVLALAAVALAGPAEPAHAATEPGEIVYRLKGTPHPQLLRVAPQRTRSVLRRLAADPQVAYATPNHVAHASAFIPRDNGAAPGMTGTRRGWTRRQWNFLPCGSPCGGRRLAAFVPTSVGGVDALGAWANLRRAGKPGAAGTVVAVLDTGIAYRNIKGVSRRSPDFGPRRFVRGWDFVDGDRIAVDINGHGTHIAGTIGEQTGNRIGVTGLAYRAKLMPVRVLDDHAAGDADAIARGIRFAARHGADVINMSFNFGCGLDVPVVDEAVRYAVGHGAVLVASTGNFECVASPAGLPGVITVAGSTEGGCRGTYSPVDADIDLIAPGGGLPAGTCENQADRPIFQLTLRRPGSLRFGFPRYYTGTSTAAAHVSGAAAMVIASRSVGRDPSPSRVLTRLRRTARDLGLPAEEQGAGLLDVAAATRPRR